MTRTPAASREVRQEFRAPRPRQARSVKRMAEFPIDTAGANGQLAAGLVFRALPLGAALLALAALLNRTADEPVPARDPGMADGGQRHSPVTVDDDAAARRARYRHNVATGARYFVR